MASVNQLRNYIAKGLNKFVGGIRQYFTSTILPLFSKSKYSNANNVSSPKETFEDLQSLINESKLSDVNENAAQNLNEYQIIISWWMWGHLKNLKSELIKSNKSNATKIDIFKEDNIININGYLFIENESYRDFSEDQKHILFRYFCTNLYTFLGDNFTNELYKTFENDVKAKKLPSDIMNFVNLIYEKVENWYHDSDKIDRKLDKILVEYENSSNIHNQKSSNAVPSSSPKSFIDKSKKNPPEPQQFNI